MEVEKMGLFDNVGDALNSAKKALGKVKSDPARYRRVSERCGECSGTGVCPGCSGDPKRGGLPRLRSGCTVVVVMANAVVIGGCIAGRTGFNFETWTIANVSGVGVLLLATFFDRLETWTCGKCDWRSDKHGGRCSACRGSGSQQHDVYEGGTTLQDAIKGAVRNIGDVMEAGKFAEKAMRVSNTNLMNAEVFADRALEMNPENTAANAIKGALLFQRGQYEKSVGYLEKAESRNPDDVMLKQMLCFVFQKLGQEERAQRKFLQMVSLGVRANDRETLMRGISLTGLAAGVLGVFLPRSDQ